MSSPSIPQHLQQVRQIQLENVRFDQALRSGEITQAQHDIVMAHQRQRMADLQKPYTTTYSQGTRTQPQPKPQPKPVGSKETVGSQPPRQTDEVQPPRQTDEVQPPRQTDEVQPPRQTDVVFVSGPIDQRNIDLYAARGLVLVPESTKVPRGAKVTASKVKDDQVYVASKTSEVQKLEKQLNLDAARWEQAGFPDVAGQILFPDLSEYGEGAKISRVVEREEGGFDLTISMPERMDDSTRLQLMQESLRGSGVREYNVAVAAKSAEFSALPLDVKISELKRLWPESLEGVNPEQISDVQFKGGKLTFSTQAAPDVDVLRLQGLRASHQAFKQSTKEAVTEAEPDFMGPRMGFRVPPGYEFKGVKEETLSPLSPDAERLTGDWLSYGESEKWTQPTGKEAKVTKMMFEAKGVQYGGVFVPEHLANIPLGNIYGLTPRMLATASQDPIMKDVVVPSFTVAGVAATAFVAPFMLPVTAKAVVAGAGFGVAFDTGFKSIQAGQFTLPTYQEAATSALTGAVFTAGASGVIQVGRAFYVTKVAGTRIAQGMTKEILPVFKGPITAAGKTTIAKGMRTEITPTFRAIGRTIDPRTNPTIQQSRIARGMKQEIVPGFKGIGDDIVKAVKPAEVRYYEQIRPTKKLTTLDDVFKEELPFYSEKTTGDFTLSTPLGTSDDAIRLAEQRYGSTAIASLDDPVQATPLTPPKPQISRGDLELNKFMRQARPIEEFSSLTQYGQAAPKPQPKVQVSGNVFKPVKQLREGASWGNLYDADAKKAAVEAKNVFDELPKVVKEPVYFAKQKAKPLTQLRYGAAWGDQDISKAVTTGKSETQLILKELPKVTTAERVMFGKNVAKPLTQLRYGAAWGTAYDMPKSAPTKTETTPALKPITVTAKISKPKQKTTPQTMMYFTQPQ